MAKIRHEHLVRPYCGRFSPAIQYFVDRVEELSRGSLRVEAHHEWGNFADDAEQQVVRAVAAGDADLAGVGAPVLDTLGVTSFRALRRRC